MSETIRPAQENPFQQTLDDYWRQVGIHIDTNGYNDPFLLSAAEGFRHFYNDPEMKAAIDDFHVEALSWRYGTSEQLQQLMSNRRNFDYSQIKVDKKKALTGIELYELEVRMLTRYAAYYATAHNEEVVVPDPRYLRPEAYMGLFEWVLSDLRDDFLTELSYRSRQTSLGTRYFDLGLAAYGHLSEDSLICEIGPSDMMGMLERAEAMPFDYVPLHLEGETYSDPHSQKASRILNEYVNDPSSLPFKTAVGIDPIDAREEANYQHIQFCKRPSELPDSYISRQNYLSRMRRQPRLHQFVGELTTGGIVSYGEADKQMDISNVKFDVFVLKTSASYFTPRLKKRFLSVLKEYANRDTVAVVTDHMSVDTSKKGSRSLHFFDNRVNPHTYRTVLFGLDGELDGQPTPMITYSTGRCERGGLTPEFMAETPVAHALLKSA